MQMSPGKAARKSCILKNCITFLTKLFFYFVAVASKYPLFASCLDLVLVSSIAPLDDQHGLVILASNSPVDSIGFIARLESPLMINLSSD